jgi:ferredoxin
MRVTFSKSGLSADWDPNSYSLLEFAEERGLDPPFSCRAGICSTCKTRLVSGKVDYFERPLEELGEGEALLCCSKPAMDVVLEI